MFEELSAGYYVGQLYVEPYDGDHAAIEREQHERANEQVYADGGAVERLDYPLVMKLGETHFPVFSTDDVQMDTLGLPAPLIEATRIEDPPTLKEVFLAKADQAAQLLQWFTPYEVSDTDFVPQ